MNNIIAQKWQNRWLCSPEFHDAPQLALLHRQLDPNFKMPPHREELKNYHALFRKKVVLANAPKRALLRISADDYYKLYVNGQFVTQGPANSYAFCYYYNVVDLTPWLRQGNNQLAIHVYYQGLVNRAYNSGDQRQGLIAELFADGVQLLDEDWLCARAEEYSYSRTIAYDTQFDEIIDERRKLHGWKLLDYDDSDWRKAPVKENDDHILIPQPTPNVVTELRFPVQTSRTENGWLLDFGEELTGTFSMKAVGKAGNMLTLHFGEELESSSAVRYEMRCNCNYEDRWILADGENELEPFEYKCFRYVQILFSTAPESPDAPRLSEFKVNFRHYPFAEVPCAFQTDDPLVRGIWSICKNAVRNCSQEAFLDCPSREKGQYLGDLTVTAHALYCLTGDTKLFKKALLDFSHSTVICPGMMAVAPGNFMQEIADFSLLYPYQLLLYYRFTGDKEFLRDMLPYAQGISEYFDRFRREDGLIENVKTKWNLVDWPQNLRDNYDFDLPQPVVGDGCHNVINALYIGMKQCIEEICKILDLPCTPQSAALRQAFIRGFYNEATGLFTDSLVSSHSSLHANAFAAFYGLAPEGNQIADFIMRKGLCCGVFVSYFVLYALIRLGRPQDAYALITNHSEHSWYEMLQEGATTAYEAWGKDQKWNTSLCHAWASAPIPVLCDLAKLKMPSLR